MFWADKLITTLNPQLPQLINDSKTPSGHAHVGALRGVVIHDVMFRALQEHGFNARYTFGVDDYDPLDELPYGQNEQFAPFLGRPLCEVPPPPGTNASDMADYYISEFFNVFEYIGVKVATYRLRDIYRSGQFDTAIDTILSRANKIRDIYHAVSGSVRPPNWLPLQMICEQCGRIGTTEAYSYDGHEVSYRCRPDLVKWAIGCGYEGKGTPFGGHSKLPWKLEWVAKWATQGITVEGAGKDHATKGGSRDVASACLQTIFGKTSPLNIPYEFFLVEGAKMSSSRGIGASAREMADFLPPEILRFLMLRSPPNRPINFSPSEESIIKLFNEFDRCRATAMMALAPPPFMENKHEVARARIYKFSEVMTTENYEVPGIQLIQALVQLPHLDVVTEIGNRSHKPLTTVDLKHLQQRIASVKYWLQNYSSDSERLDLQTTLPEQAATLSTTQKVFLQHLATELTTVDWDGDVLQSLIFSVAKLLPIPPQEAFVAIYTVLFARPLGPRAGPLFSYLEREFLIQRFSSVTIQ